MAGAGGVHRHPAVLHVPGQERHRQAGRDSGPALARTAGTGDPREEGLPGLPAILPAAKARVFLDVEGVPDRDFYYLVRALVEASGQTRSTPFWADGAADERRVWHDLLALLAGLGPFTLYHYGRYDHTFLDHMTGRYGVPPGAEPLVERLKPEAVDVLAAVSGSVYFPTHSRSLKAIGTFLGATWSDQAASGIQSLVWRHQWGADGRCSPEGVAPPVQLGGLLSLTDADRRARRAHPGDYRRCDGGRPPRGPAGTSRAPIWARSAGEPGNRPDHRDRLLQLPDDQGVLPDRPGPPPGLRRTRWAAAVLQG